MNTLEFFLGGGGDESPRWGHLPRIGGRGIRALSQILSDEIEFILFIKTHSYGGALTSDFMEDHSSPTSIFPVSMMRSSKWKHVPRHWLLWGNSPVTAGNSPVTGKFPSHRPVTRSFDVFFDLRLNKRLSKQPRRRWCETPSQSLWCHCNVVSNSDPVIFRRSTRHSCPILNLWNGSNWGFRALWKEWLQIWHTALPWLPFLEISYILHSAAV